MENVSISTSKPSCFPTNVSPAYEELGANCKSDLDWSWVPRLRPEALPSKKAKCPGVELGHCFSTQRRDFISPHPHPCHHRNNKECWRGCGERGALLLSDGNVQPLWNCTWNPVTLTLEVAQEPAIPFLVIHHKDTRTSTSTAALTQDVPNASSRPTLSCLVLPFLSHSLPAQPTSHHNHPSFHSSLF